MMTTEQSLRTPADRAYRPDGEAGAVLVGTTGFDHAAWQGDFYDEQLPPDWRFLHYGNQFRALLLPAAATLEWIGGGLPELVEDSDEDFRFVIEIDEMLADDERLASALDSLGVRLSGIVFRPVKSVFDAAAVRRLSTRHAICVDAAVSAPATDLARTLDVSTVWRPEREPSPRRGPLMVARIGASTLAELRRVIETLGAVQATCRRGVFFDDPRSAPGLARQCRILAEMLGV